MEIQNYTERNVQPDLQSTRSDMMRVNQLINQSINQPSEIVLKAP